MRETTEQRRARHAWNAVTALKNNEGRYGEDAKEYAREAKKLPIRIIASGLGQALAFIDSKAKDKKPKLKKLHENLSGWVLRERALKKDSGLSLLKEIIKEDSQFLRRATDEVIAYLMWLNRFLEAEIGDVQSEGGNE